MWDGKSRIADFAAHMERLEKHAERLRIDLPDDFAAAIAKAICRFSDRNNENQRLLLTIRYSTLDDVSLA